MDEGVERLINAARCGNVDCLLQRGDMDEGVERLINAARCGNVEGVRQYVTTENINSEGSLNLTALGEACRAAHKDVVIFLLEAGAKVGDVLHHACEYKFFDLVDVMLSSGAPTDTYDKYGRTPLIVAVQRQSVELVQTLLKHGAPVNQMDKKCCFTPLYKACETECFPIVRALLEFGASVNLKGTSRYTPLHIACWKNRCLSIIECLLKHGASVDEADEVGDTSLHYVCERGRLDMVRLLLQHGASVNIPNEQHETPLRLVVEDPVTSILLDYGAGMGSCDIHDCPELLCLYLDHLRFCPIDHIGRCPVDAYSRYFIKVKAAGIHHCLMNDRWKLDVDDIGVPSLSPHRSQREVELFSFECSAEIKRLKRLKLGENVTYFDLLCRKKSALYNEAIIDSWCPKTVEEFPIYGDIIYSIYLKIPECVKRQGLIGKCSFFFELTVFASLPPELVWLILEHLPNEDLEHLVEIIETEGSTSGLQA